MSSTAARVGTATVLAAALAGLSLEGYSRARLAPSPSTRSRVNDTPVLDHVAGAGPYGGEVNSLAVTRSVPATAFVALLGGGVYRSTDRGETWRPADRGLPADIGCDLVADPVDGATLYASCLDDGLFKTIDGGGLWRQLDVDNPDAPVVAAADPRVLYIGSVRSQDGGRRWSVTSTPTRAPWCHDGTRVVDSRDAQSLFCVSEEGLMASRSGGDRWTLMPGPAGVELSSLIALPGVADRLLASTADGAVYTITDHGAAWTQIGHVPGGNVSELRIDDAGTVVFGKQDDALARSLDGGRTWHTLTMPGPAFGLSTYAIDPRDPQIVYLGTWDGPYVSLDGGSTWRLGVRGLTRAAPAVLAVHEGPRATLLAAVGAEVLTSDDGGATWSALQGAGFPGPIEARSLKSDGAGGVWLTAGRRGVRWKAGSNGWADDDTPAGTPHAVRLPSGVIPSAVITVGTDPRHLLASLGGMQALGTKMRPGVWRSLDGGVTWNATLTPTDGLLGCCTLLRDPNEADTVYAILSGMVIGGGGAEVWRSVDAGVTWKVAGLFADAVTVVPTRRTLLLAQTYQRGLVRSTDGGVSWASAGTGLPDEAVVTNFAFDRRRPTTIFAATRSRGIYRSEDAGLSWTPAGY